jgi:hypothetical protein
MTRLGLVAAVLLAGCFDSLVDDPCASGYQLVDGACVVQDVAPDAGTSNPGDDAGPGTDAGGLVCTLPELECHGACIDVSSDPDNCGACDRVCASGICQAAHCLGELSGHIIAIGHDYQAQHAAMRTVLGNAVALGAQPDVGVARLRGSSSAASSAGTTLAITQSMASRGRPWHAVTLATTPSATALAEADVLVIEAQTGDGDAATAAGVAWASAIDGFLQRGGVVVVLEGANGVSYRFADGAGLFSIAAPVDSTSSVALVTDASDAIAQQVVSPYLAELTSVAFPGLAGAIVTPNGTLAFHQTRY